jgi:DNA-binding SARP family transcriptional activator/TolB-like protein
VIELSLLGTPELRRSGETSDAVLVQPRRLAVLAYLASARGAFHRRDRLLLLFWGDQPESRARASLRQALYFIRRALGDDILIARGDEEIGLNTAIARVDVAELERAVANGHPERALELYRGDFLADLNVDDAPEFERWVSERRRELRRMVVGAAWQLADAALAAGAHDDAVSWARRAVHLADFADGDARRAMRIMASANDRVAALETYDTVRRRLHADLDTVPDAATSALAEEIRLGASTPALPVDVAPPVAETSIFVERPVVMKPSQRGVRMLSAGAALAACIVIGVMVARRTRPQPVDPAVASRVAVLPFTVRSSRGQAAYLRDGMATLLGLALDGAGRLRVIDPNAVLTASPPAIDLEAGRRVASALGAGRFVLGEIEVAGPQINVAATLYDAAGGAQERATATGDENHVFELVDSLARRLAIVAMTDSTVRLANEASTSTRSLDAFKSFLAGETAMRSGHYREAVVSLQRAIAADSTFGLAYYRLALAREWTDGEISSDSAAALAEHFAAHVPDRDRKLLAARRAFVRRDAVEGERLSREVLATYPTDADAWLQLGEVLFHLGPNSGRSIEEARGPFVNVLRYRPNDLSARVHLTRIAARAGDVAHLNEWSALNSWSGDASEIGAFELAAMRAAVLGDEHARDSVGAALKRANEASILSTIWRLAIYGGNPEEIVEIDSLRRVAGFNSQEHAYYAELTRGRIQPMRLASIELTREHARQTALMLALPSAPTLLPQARRQHDELRRLLGGQAGVSLAPLLIAARMLEARYPDSLSAVQTAVTMNAAQAATVAAITTAMHEIAVRPAHVLELVAPAQLDEATLAGAILYDMAASIRAEALHALHRDAESIAWLQSIGMNSAGSAFGIAFATRRLADMEDARGDHAAAQRYRRRFAALWKYSDPDLRPLVDAALRN